MIGFMKVNALVNFKPYFVFSRICCKCIKLRFLALASQKIASFCELRGSKARGSLSSATFKIIHENFIKRQILKILSFSKFFSVM